MISRVFLLRLVCVLAAGIILAGTQACDKNDPVEPTPETAIRGKVTDPGASAPVESVEVWISPPGTTMVYTNGAGDYHIPKLAPGSYDLFVMKGFYEIKTRTVMVRKEQTVSASFTIREIVDDGEFDFWGKFRWHHYYVSKGSWHWSQARSLSIGQGGHMVTISDAAEDSLVYEIAKWVNLNMPIGLTDEVQEGTWLWVTGETDQYRNWLTGEPNNSQGIEHYGHVYVANGFWNDYSGTTPTPFVLEIE